ncbi:LysM peptidoglycan-binding domain-containing protein [Candidatus Woesebacteria bacterium]|nr:MAG: LysM peptidoglycan-binding domain-containing protein [Candidatus Woesebacteria bacterium]
MKSFLKKIKLNESTISMGLGTIVIIIVGVLVVNYFKTIETPSVLPQDELEITTNELETPTNQHTVVAGEDLWKISENYYGTGYNWTDIAQANNLTSPGSIKEGQVLTLPNTEPKLIGSELADNQNVTVIPTNTMETQPLVTLVEITPTNEPDRGTLLSEAASDEVVDTTINADETGESDMPSDKIEGETYTVVRGDNLWKIAERAYGDGYKWVDIAKANKLVNPSIIHAGNVFVIPR